jgi:hypothetical protein
MQITGESNYVIEKIMYIYSLIISDIAHLIAQHLSQLCVKFVIRADAPDRMLKLFKYINHTTELTSVMYKGLTYVPGGVATPKSGRGRPISQITHDPAIKCKGDLDICESPPLIFPDNPDDVVYNLTYQFVQKPYEKLYRELTKCGAHPKDIYIIGNVKRHSIVSIQTEEDDDTSCRNHCNIYLHRYTRQDLHLPVTLQDLVICQERMLYVKFDSLFMSSIEFKGSPKDKFYTYIIDQEYIG